LKDIIEDIEQRYKVMSLLNWFLEMKRIVHNFVNPHMQLKWFNPCGNGGGKIGIRAKQVAFINQIFIHDDNMGHTD